MPKAVITGAAGFAGFSVTRELLSRGYKVYAILKPGSAHNARLSDLSGDLDSVELDCAEFDKISDYINEKCDLFINLAWFGGRDDFYIQKNNIDCCLMALESASRLGCSRFIGIGSQAEYGISAGCMTEELMPSPINAYGSAKVSAMYLSKKRSEQLDIEWIWGRIFSLYGDYEPSGRMLPDLIVNLKAGRNVSLSSCEQNWDYLHVTDAARAIACLAEKGHSGEIYNIANGDYKPLKVFTETVQKLLECNGIICYGSKADPFVSLQPDVTKLMAHTGWKPIVGFEEGVLKFANEEN